MAKAVKCIIVALVVLISALFIVKAIMFQKDLNSGVKYDSPVSNTIIRNM